MRAPGRFWKLTPSQPSTPRWGNKNITRELCSLWLRSFTFRPTRGGRVTPPRWAWTAWARCRTSLTGSSESPSLPPDTRSRSLVRLWELLRLPLCRGLGPRTRSPWEESVIPLTTTLSHNTPGSPPLSHLQSITLWRFMNNSTFILNIYHILSVNKL